MNHSLSNYDKMKRFINTKRHFTWPQAMKEIKMYNLNIYYWLQSLIEVGIIHEDEDGNYIVDKKMGVSTTW